MAKWTCQLHKEPTKVLGSGETQNLVVHCERPLANKEPKYCLQTAIREECGPVLDLPASHSLVVPLKAFEMDDEGVRKNPEAVPFHRINLAPKILTEVGVVPLHQLSLHVEVQTLLQHPKF